MPRCDVCGNDYDKAIEVIVEGHTHVFDCFECAVHRLAPPCAHCGCRVIGHGVEEQGVVFCCAGCARQPRHERRSRGDDAIDSGAPSHA